MQYRQLEGNAAKLADQVLEATQTIERLSAKREREEGRGSHDFKQLVADLWDMPQIRLLLASLVGLAHLVLFPPDRYSDHFTADLAFGIPQIYLLCKWIAKQYRMDGPLQLLIKMFLYICCPFICLVITESYPDISSVLVRNEATTLSVLLVIFTILAASRLAEWLVDDVGGRLWDSEPLQFVRRCF